MGSRSWVSVVLAGLVLGGCQRPAEPRPQARPAVPGLTTGQPTPEPLFFIPGDATLSPGALAKLKTWVAAWGLQGTWTLTVPTGPGLTYELTERRVLAIRTELRRLGVPRVETILGAQASAGPYDAIYVAKGPP